MHMHMEEKVSAKSLSSQPMMRYLKPLKQSEIECGAKLHKITICHFRPSRLLKSGSPLCLLHLKQASYISPSSHISLILEDHMHTKT